MDSKILGHLQRKINERIEDVIESIASGGSKDFAEYNANYGLLKINQLLRPTRPQVFIS